MNVLGLFCALAAVNTVALFILARAWFRQTESFARLVWDDGFGNGYLRAIEDVRMKGLEEVATQIRIEPEKLS